MRRFSFHIDLTGGAGDRTPPPKASAPGPVDGFGSGPGLFGTPAERALWARYQSALEELPSVEVSPEGFPDPHLAQEHLRAYRASRQRVLDARVGFSLDERTESHCFFGGEGSKHLLGRLLSAPDQRLTELTLFSNGDLLRVYYERNEGPVQPLEELFLEGLSGLDRDLQRFRLFPGYRLVGSFWSLRQEALVRFERAHCIYLPDTDELQWHEENV